MSQRAKIRAYIETMLKAGVDVGGRVFFARVEPLMMEEIPAVVFSFGGEEVTTDSGDNYQPTEYIRTLKMEVFIQTQTSWDHLDYLAAQVEKTISDDHMLAKLLPGYDPENFDCLCGGISLQSVNPYMLGKEGETPMYGQALTYNVPYKLDIFASKKYDNFDNFQFDIQNAAGVTVIAGEVDL